MRSTQTLVEIYNTSLFQCIPIADLIKTIYFILIIHTILPAEDCARETKSLCVRDSTEDCHWKSGGKLPTSIGKLDQGS